MAAFPTGRVPLNIKQLKYVCAIMDSGSFSSAAAHEGVSVQAVSKAMAELEGKVGTPLFERMSAGVKPTPYGRAFAVRARRVLDEWNGLERFVSARENGGAVEGPLRMGFCCLQYSGVEKFCMLISTITGRVLGRKVDVLLEPCSSALDDLRTGKLDAIITLGSVDEDDMTCSGLGTLGTCVILSEDHPLAKKDVVTLDDLADYPVLDPAGIYEHFHDAVVEPYFESGLRSERCVVNTDKEDAVHFVENGGYSFMVGGNITGAPEGSTLRPIAPKDMIATPICLITPKDSLAIDHVEFRRALAKLSLFS